MWMNGGAGASSMIGALQENGPCFVESDSNTTYLNPYSWNNQVNMLYIDQPVQVGYSYDVPTNVTVSAKSGEVVAQDFSSQVPEQNNTLFVGTLSSQNSTSTANATERAAHALWHFAQIWFEEFPHYKPVDEKISIWTESYGGIYGPAFAALFEEQNQKIKNGTIKGPGAHYLRLDTLGIVNGCVDFLINLASYPSFSYNNTYGIQAINQTIYEKAMREWEKPGGPRDKILDCRAAAGDPDINADQSNEICAKATIYAYPEMEGPFANFSGRGRYDITHPSQDPFPPPYFLGFLNQNWVQQSLGVPLNFTTQSSTVLEGFVNTGDFVREGAITQLAYVLDSGIKVALVYGDRDYACNWIGGEQISQKINHTSSKDFARAGYAPIHVNESYTGGQVRQYGNLSFSRVYQSGHMVPAYQPETAYEIFMRVMFNKDVATGTIESSDDYSTIGPSSTWHIKNEVFPSPQPVCYILDAGDRCTEDQWALVENGTAVVKEYVVVGREEEERHVSVSESVFSDASLSQERVQQALNNPSR